MCYCTISYEPLVFSFKNLGFDSTNLSTLAAILTSAGKGTNERLVGSKSGKTLPASGEQAFLRGRQPPLTFSNFQLPVFTHSSEISAFWGCPAHLKSQLGRSKPLHLVCPALAPPSVISSDLHTSAFCFSRLLPTSIAHM